MIGNWGTQKADAGVTGYKANHGGIVLGGNLCISPKLKLGATAAYVHTGVNSYDTGANHSLKADTWQLGMYGNAVLSDCMDMDFNVGLGRTSMAGKRHIMLPRNTSRLSAKSDTQANLAKGYRDVTGNVSFLMRF